MADEAAIPSAQAKVDGADTVLDATHAYDGPGILVPSANVNDLMVRNPLVYCSDTVLRLPVLERVHSTLQYEGACQSGRLSHTNARFGHVSSIIGEFSLGSIIVRI